MESDSIGTIEVVRVWIVEANGNKEIITIDKKYEVFIEEGDTIK